MSENEKFYLLVHPEVIDRCAKKGREDAIRIQKKIRRIIEGSKKNYYILPSIGGNPRVIPEGIPKDRKIIVGGASSGTCVKIMHTTLLEENYQAEIGNDISIKGRYSL